MTHKWIRTTSALAVFALAGSVFGVSGCDWFAGPLPTGAGSDSGGGSDGTVPPGDDMGEDAPSVEASPPGDGALSDDSGDAGDASNEGGSDVAAADACAACLDGCFGGVCTGPFTGISATAAAQTMGGTAVVLVQTPSNGSSTGGGPASTSSSVTVTTKTSPGGSCQSVLLTYATNPSLTTPSQVPMTIQGSTSSADTWTADIPAQTSPTEVYFYLQATPVNGATAYDPNGFGVHYAYAVK